MRVTLHAIASMLLLTLVALSGCSDGGDDTGSSPTQTATGTTVTSTRTGTGAGDGKEHSLTFSSDTTSGMAPLTVTFTAELTATQNGSNVEPDDFEWTLQFGDGSPAAEGSGEDNPWQESHEYSTGGDYTAVLEVKVDTGENLTASIDISVEADGDSEPPQLVYELGPSGGCLGGNGGDTCPSIEAAKEGAPPTSGVDGHWISIDERYWGLEMIAEMSLPGNSDSDCYILDADFNIIADGANGGDPCRVPSVPNDAAWAFVFPWATPTESMYVEFS